MKAFEILIITIVGGCLCSAFIGELLIDGHYDFQHILQKGSFYAILVFIILIFAYYGMKSYISKIKKEIIQETNKQLKNDLKNEIKKELVNELKQQITREVRIKYHNMRKTVADSVKDDFKEDMKGDLGTQFKEEISRNIKIELIENAQWIEYIIYKISQKNESNDKLIELSSLHDRLETKIDDLINNITPKISEGAGK
ncbi:hypothetical protein [Heyndrickxia oleronia]|uniref:hypothetical protein n=1 Tax=Heyndrickxia oleronia TaxID=38875 RepID=UPI001C0EC4BD|nr:hypothetical protein [Heyndrickxia oleronia]MBU5213585.1 hypothetical protein [Heyndrickxia oleronia]